jgi:hypothetical protein
MPYAPSTVTSFREVLIFTLINPLLGWSAAVSLPVEFLPNASFGAFFGAFLAAFLAEFVGFVLAAG